MKIQENVLPISYADTKKKHFTSVNCFFEYQQHLHKSEMYSLFLFTEPVENVRSVYTTQQDSVVKNVYLLILVILLLCQRVTVKVRRCYHTHMQAHIRMQAHTNAHIHTR